MNIRPRAEETLNLTIQSILQLRPVSQALFLGHVGHPLRWDETDDVEWTPLVLTGKIPLVLTGKIPRPPLGGVAFQRASSKENSSVARPVAEAVSREDISGCRHRGREQTQFGISWPQGE
jgi:hypothetical protein